MRFDAFLDIVRRADRPVILLEGTRALPDAERPALARLARALATLLPGAIFRSGNAPGSDAAFAEGVAAVDQRRLEVVLPHPGHRGSWMPRGAYAASINDISRQTLRALVELTGSATPRHMALAERFDPLGSRLSPKPEAIIRLILRDALKVVGDPDTILAPATVGIFRENLEDPDAGGTGHTIRCCREMGVPVALSHDWRRWMRQMGGALPA